jgi:pSer/pThr/pTyr-binding forkhead associated (FHA) protein
LIFKLKGQRVAYLTQYSGSVPVIKFNIDQSLMTIGQDLDMDICVPEEGISDNYALIKAVKNNESYRFVIKTREDEPQFNINGETASLAELQDGDWIIIGDVEFQFSNDGINDIKQVEQPAVEEIEMTKLQLVSESAPVKQIEDVQVEAESLAADSMEDDHRFSRRLNFF